MQSHVRYSLLCFAALICFTSPVAHAGFSAPSPQGDRFQISNASDDLIFQFRDIGCDRGERWITTWTDVGAVYYRYYHSGTQPKTDAVWANSENFIGARDAACAMNGKGEAWVVWIRGNNSKIQGRPIDAQGNAGAEVDLGLVPPNTTGLAIEATLADDGRLSLAFLEENTTADTTILRVIRLFGNQPAEDTGLVTGFGAGDIRIKDPHIASSPDGTVDVVWVVEVTGGTSLLRTSTFPPNGPIGRTQTLSSSVLGLASPRIAKTSTGQSMTVWLHDEEIGPETFFNASFLRLDPAGDPIELEKPLDVRSFQTAVNLCVTAGDIFMPIWSNDLGSGDDPIYGKFVHESVVSLVTDPFPLGVLPESAVGSGGIQIGCCPAKENHFAVLQVGSAGAEGPEVYGQWFKTGTGRRSPDRSLRYANDAGDLQVNADTASDAEGNFIIVWQEQVETAPNVYDPTGIWARLFFRDGQPKAEAFRIDSPVGTADGECPAVAMEPDGDFIVAWRNTFPNGFRQITAKMYNASGAQKLAQFIASSSNTTIGCPDVATKSGSRSVVVWRQGGNGAGEIFGRSFTNNGQSQQVVPKRIDSTPDGSAGSPRIVSDPSSSEEFVLIWARDSTPSDFLVERTMDASLNLQSPNILSINPTILSPSISYNSSGERVIAWHNPDIDAIISGRYRPDDDHIRLILSEGTLSSPGIGVLADGSYITAWQRNDAASVFDVELIRHSPEDAMVGIETSVSNGLGTDRRFSPDVCPLTFGQCVAAWTETNQSGNESRIRYRVTGLSGDTPQLLGTALPTDFTSANEKSQPAVAMLDDGKKFAVWQDQGQDGSGWGIFGSVFDEINFSVFPVDSLPQTTVGNQQTPDVAVLDDQAAVVWQLANSDGVGVRIFSTNSETLTPTSPEQSAFSLGGTFSTPHIASDRDDLAIITCDRIRPGLFVSDIYVRWITDTGALLVSQEVISLGKIFGGHDVAMAEDGSAVIVWSQREGLVGANEIFFLRYDGGRNQIPDIVPYDPEATRGSRSAPVIAMAPDGRFVIVCEGPDDDGGGIFAQCFTSGGLPVGPEFEVNDVTALAQSDPSVAMDGEGNFTVSWTSRTDAGDSSETDIKYQFFDFSGNAAGDEQRAHHSFDGTQSRSDISANPDGDLALVFDSESPADSIQIQNLTQNLEFSDAYLVWSARFGVDGILDYHADIDFDGSTNLEEYLANTDPTDPRSVDRIGFFLEESGDDFFPSLRTRLRLDDDLLDFDLEISTDLATWTGTDGLSPRVVCEHGDGTTTVEIVFPADISVFGTHAYFRIVPSRELE